MTHSPLNFKFLSTIVEHEVYSAPVQIGVGRTAGNKKIILVR